MSTVHVNSKQTNFVGYSHNCHYLIMKQ